MKTRIEHDALGEISVPADRCWGAQTQRSFENFPIGTERMPAEIIRAFALLKKAAAQANSVLCPAKMTSEKNAIISTVCDEILSGKLEDEFPLKVWQTGSGTQTNMNLNEVISVRGNSLAGKTLLHPNDDVNLSQSSNDTFPTALYIAAALSLKERLFPALEHMISTLTMLEATYADTLKCGRTHLQDAVPLTFGQEVSGWNGMLKQSLSSLRNASPTLCGLAIGGTAVGTGLNAPRQFGSDVARLLADWTDCPFTSLENKFYGLTSHDRLVSVHGQLKGLAADLMKIANDIRFLASGPRCGFGELFLPENEPGSSIMPGKVNPTQCEAVTMVAVQVMGNDTAIGIAASQGNFELNVFLPVLAYDFLQSVRLLSDAITSFDLRCVGGIRVNEAKMKEYVDRSLMTVTALTPQIGYENGAKIAQLAQKENLTLKQAAVRLGILTEERFDELFHPEEMI